MSTQPGPSQRPIGTMTQVALIVLFATALAVAAFAAASILLV